MENTESKKNIVPAKNGRPPVDTIKPKPIQSKSHSHISKEWLDECDKNAVLEHENMKLQAKITKLEADCYAHVRNMFVECVAIFSVAWVITDIAHNIFMLIETLNFR